MLPLAAALSIPLTTVDGGPLQGRNHVVLLTTAVIVITLLVQGFTLGPLVRRAGVATAPSQTRDDAVAARNAMTTAALNHLDHLDHLEAAPKPAIVHLRRTRLAQMSPDDGVDDLVGTVIRQLRRDLIEVETAVLTQLYHQGTIDEITRRKLQRRLDLEDASLDY